LAEAHKHVQHTENASAINTVFHGEMGVVTVWVKIRPGMLWNYNNFIFQRPQDWM